jgi:tRNA threonylcarbamoyladenosine modification (KEOPS) complex Cgi121 subunit
MFYRIQDTHVSLICVDRIQQRQISKLIDEIHETSSDIFIQVVDPSLIYGIDHILGALKISIESKNRRIMAAKRLEIDLLLRLFCTDQISSALKLAAPKKNCHGCLIIFSRNKKQMTVVKGYVERLFVCIDQSILLPTKTKRKMICSNLHLASGDFLEDREFTMYLLERAALIIG